MMNKCLARDETRSAENATSRTKSPIPDNFFARKRFGIVFVLTFGVIVIVAVMSG
jgi:hypothetical protein